MLPANTARREVGKRRGDWRADAGMETVEGVGVGRRETGLGSAEFALLVGCSGETDDGIGGLRVNMPKTIVS